MKRSMILRLVAAVLALALVGVACSDSGSDGGTNDESSTGAEGSLNEGSSMNEDESTQNEDNDAAVVAAVTVDNPAATLTRDLAHLLNGHEYHAGLAVLTAVQAGGDLEDPTFKAAAAALDDNSKSLAAAIESLYGPEAGKQFLSLWRAHIGFFVDYTLGKATNDPKMVKTARKDLDGYRSDFGAFIEGATEGALTQKAVEDALKMHVNATFKAIDAVVAGKTNAFAKLQTAADHMPMLATALSTGISTQQELEGSPDDAAANLQRDLTHLLDSHEYHAGLAVLTAVQAGGDLNDPTFKAAAGALDENSKALAKAIESVYGKAGGKQFLSLWRAHIGFFVDYTLGKATGDNAMATTAQKKLDGYRADFGAFLEGATEGALTQEAVAEALIPHVKSTSQAIDSVVAGDGKAFKKLQTAAHHLPMLATVIAGAIVDQFPDNFAA
jgi:hypothetical protein